MRTNTARQTSSEFLIVFESLVCELLHIPLDAAREVLEHRGTTGQHNVLNEKRGRGEEEDGGGESEEQEEEEERRYQQNTTRFGRAEKAQQK